ncbi:DNA/RNA nuclease SfsA [Aquifex sp.]
MEFPHLKPAIFVRRLNRFVGEVFLGGRLVRALIRNTGRLSELLKEGNTVFVREKSNGKYRYEVLLARSEKGLVCIESHYANALFEEYLLNKGVRGFRREPKFRGKRFDFLIDNMLVEVKSVNLVRNGVALFPDAPTKRGAEHLRILSELPEGMKPLLVFVCQREDCEDFRPNCETDPAFCRAFYEYVRKGYPVKAFRCKVSLKEIFIAEEINVRSEP